MAVTPERRLWPMATELASCLCRTIAINGLPAPCFCGVLPGEAVAYDYCAPCEGDACGMAWVRLVAAAERSVVFAATTLAATGNPCDVSLAATFEIGILRCAPTLKENGDLPTMADHLAAAELQFADMAAARESALCCFTDRRQIALGAYTPIGPEGGCLGGAWTVNIGEY